LPMSQWCESCGQHVDTSRHAEPGDHADAVWLDDTDDGHQHSFEERVDRAVAQALEQADEERQAEEEAEAARLAEIARQNDERDETAEAYEAADAAPGGPNREPFDPGPSEAGPLGNGRTVTGDIDTGAVDRVIPIHPVLVVEAGEVPPIDPPPATTLQAERISRRLVSEQSANYVAYHSDFGVVLIDLVSSQAWVLEPPTQVRAPAEGAPLLRSGASTFAFDPSSGQLTLAGADSSLVVSQTHDGATYFVDAATLNGDATIVEVVNEGSYSFHRSPNGGHQLQVIDGLGVLAVPNEAGAPTLLSDKEGFVEVTTDHVVTGSAGGIVEEVCDQEGRCSLVVTDLIGGTGSRSVPAGFDRLGHGYSLSPNGEVLLRHGPGGYGENLLLESGAIAWLTGAGMQAPAFSPDSAFVAWINVIGEPTLNLSFANPRTLMSVNLADYGVPRPSSPDMVVFGVGPGELVDVSAGVNPCDAEAILKTGYVGVASCAELPAS